MTTRAVLRETAYAKLNLALHVRERMADGYHRLETLFAFCIDGDVLEAEPADDLSLTIDGPFGEGLEIDGNLVLRAADALRTHFGIERGARLRLTKNLPVASGIGGGSADAAAALRLLGRLWDVAIEDVQASGIASELGADVPVCLISRTCAGSGRGDVLEEVSAPALSGKPVLLVNPRVAVSTPAIFGRWNGRDGGPLTLAEPVTPDPRWSNDLTAPATAMAPEIGEVLAWLGEQDGAEFVRMSGSGATCFALFANVAARDAAVAMLAQNQPGWWLLPSALR